MLPMILSVCSGGDGTLSEVLDGVMTIDEKRRPKIGYIPAGSTNDYAYSLGLPSQMKRCANVIAEEKFRAVDVGKFQENSYFVYVASIWCIYRGFLEHTAENEKCVRS